ncbi:GAF and ANTAR domain-containing protein [Nocardioides ungokensis]|uniref:GAF and ANTAR domain-containing protein n=1 Tax=Nocardioides ungokensis TaxID=1643322 RepID=UPI0015DD7E96|nr:GAF and ANTAR domain-containing protein [Nocardioides ungokensis]
MYDHSLLLRTVSELSGRLLTPHDVDAVPEHVVARLVEVFDLAGAGMALAEAGDLKSTAGCPDVVDALEQIQVAEQTGPCVQAFRTGEVLAIPDLEEYADRWPSYCEAARVRGLGSAVGIPLRLMDQSVGAVGLYGSGRRSWPPEDLEAAVVLADLVTACLVNASKVRQQEQLTEQLQGALESRTVIEQAKGVVAATHEVSIDEAFELIRRHARSHRATVRAVSDAIVSMGLEV